MHRRFELHHTYATSAPTYAAPACTDTASASASTYAASDVPVAAAFLLLPKFWPICPVQFFSSNTFSSNTSHISHLTHLYAFVCKIKVKPKTPRPNLRPMTAAAKRAKAKAKAAAKAAAKKAKAAAKKAKTEAKKARKAEEVETKAPKATKKAKTEAKKAKTEAKKAKTEAKKAKTEAKKDAEKEQAARRKRHREYHLARVRAQGWVRGQLCESDNTRRAPARGTHSASSLSLLIQLPVGGGAGWGGHLTDQRPAPHRTAPPRAYVSPAFSSPASRAAASTSSAVSENQASPKEWDGEEWDGEFGVQATSADFEWVRDWAAEEAEVVKQQDARIQAMEPIRAFLQWSNARVAAFVGGEGPPVGAGGASDQAADAAAEATKAAEAMKAAEDAVAAGEGDEDDEGGFVDVVSVEYPCQDIKTLAATTLAAATLAAATLAAATLAASGSQTTTTFGCDHGALDKIGDEDTRNVYESTPMTDTSIFQAAQGSYSEEDEVTAPFWM